MCLNCRNIFSLMLYYNITSNSGPGLLILIRVMLGSICVVAVSSLPCVERYNVWSWTNIRTFHYAWAVQIYFWPLVSFCVNKKNTFTILPPVLLLTILMKHPAWCYWYSWCYLVKFSLLFCSLCNLCMFVCIFFVSITKQRFYRAAFTLLLEARDV